MLLETSNLHTARQKRQSKTVFDKFELQIRPEVGFAEVVLRHIRNFLGVVDRGSLSAQVAIAEARWRVARLLPMRTLERVWDSVVRTGELTVEQRLALRLATTHATTQHTQARFNNYEIVGQARLGLVPLPLI